MAAAATAACVTRAGQQSGNIRPNMTIAFCFSSPTAAHRLRNVSVGVAYKGNATGLRVACQCEECNSTHHLDPSVKAIGPFTPVRYGYMRYACR